MKWHNHGTVWRPEGDKAWARRYATCPTPLLLDSERLRIYVQSRDSDDVGRIGYVDVLTEDPTRVVAVAENPVFDIGAPGAFDDNGVFQTSVLRCADGRVCMYYVGFELCRHIRYRLLTGLAISRDQGDSFERIQTTPILERSPEETTFRCGTFVMQDVDRFRMWYVAGSSWIELDGAQVPRYDIRYAESEDGVRWPPHGRTILTGASDNEYGFGRPYVRRQEDFFEMFFSVRTKSPNASHLAYATSTDGLVWHRQDTNLQVEQNQRSAAAFPAVIQAGNRTLCFYNGPGFGQAGFALAERVD